jgi:hypothetical protein
VSLDYRVTSGGLVLAEHGMDGAAVERALKSRDPDLRLQGWPSAVHDRILWKVVRYCGPDRPPETILVWAGDDGVPHPLSSGLLNALDHLDRNSRVTYLNEDQRNAARDAELARAKQEEYEALADDWNPTRGRPVLPRSQSLRLSRDKQRARGKNV